MQTFWFWFWLILSWATMAVVFWMIIRGASKLNKEQERKKCMMNHPAGKRAPIEHSHTGEISIDDSIREKYKGGYTYPHHMIAD